MAYVSNTQDEAAPTVLIVESNVMSVQRLTTIFKIKDFNIEVCEDGDKAVDEYIRLDPELVVISLDIPSLDGHLAALEMREHGGEARIMFVAPRRLAKLAADAQFSAGAVAWLQKPITSTVLEEQWDTILGPIPDAPGLEDLDELYPIDRIKPEQDDGPLPLPALPGMPLPALPAPEAIISLPPLETEPSILIAQSAKKPSAMKYIVLFLVLIAGGAGYYAYSNNLI